MTKNSSEANHEHGAATFELKSYLVKHTGVRLNASKLASRFGLTLGYVRNYCQRYAACTVTGRVEDTVIMVENGTKLKNFEHPNAILPVRTDRGLRDYGTGLGRVRFDGKK